MPEWMVVNSILLVLEEVMVMAFVGMCSARTGQVRDALFPTRGNLNHHAEYQSEYHHNRDTAD